MKNEIIVISNYELFYEYGAAYERLKCYGKALPDTYFLCFHPDFDYTQNKKRFPSKEINNLIFNSGVSLSRSLLYRTFYHYFDFYRPIKLCSYISKNYPNNKILLYSSSFPLFITVILYMMRIRKHIVIVEKNESETGIVLNSLIQDKNLAAFHLLLFPLRFFSAWMIDVLSNSASGLIAISSNIKKKYQKINNSLQIPILVDTMRFADVRHVSNDNIVKYLYLGTITPEKDGLNSLLQSFFNLSQKTKNFQFDIIGNGNRHYEAEIKQFIADNALEGRVNILPSVGSEEVPHLIKNYDIGLLVRSKNRQTNYGFSTKLAEYLAAGLLVIYTDVSDNSLFLTDNIHGFLVPFPLRDNLEIILEKALNTSACEREMIQNNARELAVNSFDYRNYSSKLKKILS